MFLTLHARHCLCDSVIVVINVVKGKHRVLVIDADPESLAETTEVLSAAEYLVTAVSEYEVAKQQLRLAAPLLLVVDVRLGPYNGLQLVLRARRDHPEMAAIVTHAFRDPVLEAEAMKAGAVYLLKPIDPTTLVDIVRTLLRTPRRNESWRTSTDCLL